MGVIIAGQEFSGEDILADIETHYRNSQKVLEALKRAEEAQEEKYREAKNRTRIALFKMIALDGIRRGKPLPWVLGKAEGAGIESWEGDEIIYALLELFN
jgi:hypothetical protein